MAWFVQALQRKGADGAPSGLWHLTATSDEGGGFVVGCEHDHASFEEAQDCREAKIKIGQATGFPVREDEPEKGLTEDQLRVELGRAYRALRAYAGATRKGEPLGAAAAAYHSLTVGAALRFVNDDALDGADYFIGKHVSVLHEALAKL